MIKFFNNITLAERNSFHINVMARELVEFDTAEDLHFIFTQFKPESWYLLSGGNNILFTHDVEPTLLVPKSQTITIEEENEQLCTIKVDAGAEWDDVVEWCVERGLWGAENLSLIPGKAGAAPIQNIGAYGTEICDIISSIDYFDTESLEVVTIPAAECEFGYRESIFKGAGRLRGRAIVVAIHLELQKKATPQLHYADLIERVAQRGEPTLRTIREVICEVRREKLPDTALMGNAGSFFKNPIVDRAVADKLLEEYPLMPKYPIKGDDSRVKLAAGWLIDKANMKGYRKGNVGVHSRQALVLVNHGGASGAEVMELAREVQRVVKERFDVEIETEVNIL